MSGAVGFGGYAVENSGEGETMVNLRTFPLAVGLLALLVGCGREAISGAVKAPANVRAEPVAGAIRVSWEYSREDAGFHVYRAVGESGTKFSKLTRDPLAGNTRVFDDIQVAQGVLYRYAVTAVGAEGESPPVEGAAPVAAGTDEPAPEGRYRLRIYWDGSSTGRGTVSSAPAGISCDVVTGLGCSATFAAGSEVTLTPHPSEGSSFEGWSPPCGAEPVCTLTLSSDLTVTATLRSAQATLALAVDGPGKIASNVGSDCRDSCSEAYPLGTLVNLTAVPAEGYAFTGWAGDCEGTGACEFELSANKSVTARFAQPKPLIQSFDASAERVRAGSEVTLSWEVTGAGRVVLSSDTGLEPTEVSGSSYTVKQSADTTYTLEASNAYGSASATLTVRVGQAPVIASFTASPTTIDPGSSATLSWQVSGEGSIALSLDHGIGEVTGKTSVEVRPEKTITYRLTAESPYGEAEAEVKVNVRRSFTLTLTKTRGGRDDGTRVTSSPAGIDCGERCQTAFPEGTAVTLSAAEPKKLEEWRVCRGLLFLNCTTSRGKTVSFTVNGDLRVTAKFKK